MAIMVPVVVMSVRGITSSKIVVIDSIGIMMVLVGIVMMKTGYRCFITQMPMHALYRRPGKLKRDKYQEKDGEEATHF